MIIYMQHHQHGNKVALCDAEATADEKNGWVRTDKGVMLTPENPAPIVEYVENIEELREMWEAKYGKKPHHKKSAETLRRELTDGYSPNSN